MAMAPERIGIGIHRHFTTAGAHPYDSVRWERRDARITNYLTGAVAFEQLGVEVPSTWSVNATNILAQKYFRGTLGTSEREQSLKAVVDRVVDSISSWGRRDGYFVDDTEAEAFSDELKYLIIHQKAAFNSPVWFNIGVKGVPQQASACFILAVEDSMSSILNWYVEEGTIFKGGSGAGINLSRIRSSEEGLRGGGTASGPVSFMRGADASAGTIKSGGKTRRAAKMVILNADHPDVEDFIWCKAIEERKARALRDAGFDMDLDGKDSHSTQYQNANNSVRVTDEFMQAVLADTDWQLNAVTTGEPVRTVKARALFRQIAKATWECADPGMQFDTTINRWHTAPVTGRINASNPCSEYMHLDNSACNLASLNLLTFLEEDSSFDVEGFKAATEVVFTAQEILVGNADYPTDKIADTSRRFRQLGIGYANLGALLMAQGVPYDSDEGRAWAAAITALLTGHSYATSARTAARMGPFAGFTDNRDAMLNVLRMHRDHVASIDEELVPTELLGAAQEAWDAAVEVGEQYGVRNSQASVVAPTGTIALLMDCDTTGIEPDLGLVKTKKLVGGGTMSIVNQTVPRALRRLGYDGAEVEAIIAYIDEHKSILGAPALRAEHLPVFACSMGDNFIHYRGHVRMMGAVQPFISGAISKCVTAETLVATSEGLTRIGKMYDGEAPDSFRPDVREVASLQGPQKTDAFYYGGVRPVWSVALRSGHRITGTPNHRLLVIGGDGLEWRQLDELKVGECVATQYGDDLWSVLPARFDVFSASPAPGSEPKADIPVEMSVDLAFVLGAFASVGRVSRFGGTITITSPVDKVLERLVSSFETVFGIKAAVVRPSEGSPSVELTSETIAEFLRFVGCGERAGNKRIPDAVLESPRAMVIAFLQGLSLGAEPSMAGMAKWRFCAESPGLLDDLQAVLTNLGVVHERVSRSARGTEREYEELSAVGEQAEELLALVPFIEPKKAALATALQSLGRHPDRNAADVVPGISPYELYRLLPRNARAEFSYLCDPRAMCVRRRSLEQVAAIPGVHLPQWLQIVLEDNLHFSPVASVAYAGEREVFDLSVPTTQAFVGNGIVNHNTVNMPEEATVEEVEQLHIEAWQLGLKAVAVYRDNCKVAQPLAMTKKGVAAPDPTLGMSPPEAHDAELAQKVAELENALKRQTVVVKQPVRERLPRRRRSMTFKFRVADCEGYVTVGEYDDGRPGEVFMQVSKQGSTLAGIMDAFAVAVSLGLQHGVPLATYVKKYTNMRFEPAGMTDDPELRIASSLVDYIFRRLAVDYLTYDERAELGILTTHERRQPTLPGVEEQTTPSSSVVEEMTVEETTDEPATGTAIVRPLDAPYCYQCGVQMQRAGSCFACPSCGSTSGCS